MNTDINVFSNQLADAVAAVAPSVVQVQGRRRPVSGLVYEPGVVVTTARALGRGDHVSVRAATGDPIEAEFSGWDPSTHLVVLRVPGLDAPPTPVSKTPVRVGHLALAVARSWSNAITASAGIVSVIGGPLPTGRHRAIDEVIRTSAPMHEGFSGGAFVDTSGQLTGVATAAAIRGLGVVIPARIAWASVAAVLSGGTRRGYLGLVGQSVTLPANQAGADASGEAVLVTAVSADGPAHAAGILVGDLLMEFDGHAVTSSDDLFGLLSGERIGRDVPLRLLRGGSEVRVTVRVGERPTQ